VLRLCVSPVKAGSASRGRLRIDGVSLVQGHGTAEGVRRRFLSKETPGSVPGDFMGEWQLTKYHCSGVFSEIFCFPLLVTIPASLHTHLSWP
jgi:hypothetical protein